MNGDTDTAPNHIGNDTIASRRLTGAIGDTKEIKMESLPCDEHVRGPVPEVLNRGQDDNGQDYYNRPSHKSSEDAMCIAILAAAGSVSGWLLSLIPTSVLVLGGMVGGVCLACLLRIGDGDR